MTRMLADDRDSGATDRPVRGYRRVEWIERALAPVRGKLGKRRFEELVSALAMVIGWEALIVARDVRGLSQKEAEDISAWAARALVRAALEDVEHPTPRRRAKADTQRKPSRKS